MILRYGDTELIGCYSFWLKKEEKGDEEFIFEHLKSGTR